MIIIVTTKIRTKLPMPLIMLPTTVCNSNYKFTRWNELYGTITIVIWYITQKSSQAQAITLIDKIEIAAVISAYIPHEFCMRKYQCTWKKLWNVNHDCVQLWQRICTKSQTENSSDASGRWESHREPSTVHHRHCNLWRNTAMTMIWKVTYSTISVCIITTLH